MSGAKSSPRESSKPLGTMMGEPRYYLRIRGVVTGPFDLGQLQSMRRLGQLARFHEVSLDGQSWDAASSLTGLFVAPAPRAARRDRNRVEPAAQEVVAAMVVDRPPDSARWWYAFDGQATGPTATVRMRELIVVGVIGPDTLVWTDGMAAWASCRDAGPAAISAAPVTPEPAPPVDGPAHQPEAVDQDSDRQPWEPDELRQTSGLAMASLFLGLTGWTFGLGSLLAVIFGIVALDRVAQSEDELSGRELAIAGIVLGVLGLLVFVVAVLIASRSWRAG